MKRTFAIVILAAVGLVACRGKLSATAELTGPGTASTHVQITGKTLTLWADTNGKWTGDEHSNMTVAYEIDVVRGGAVLGHVSCTTPSSGGVSVCGMHTTINNSHDANCELSLPCALPPVPPGDVELRVTGRTGPNVTLVRKMSLNVREK